LEGQITIVFEATSQENSRRDRRPLPLGRHESRDFFSRPLAQATTLKVTEAGETLREKRPSRG
jgi:hypothetical protein